MHLSTSFQLARHSPASRLQEDPSPALILCGNEVLNGTEQAAEATGSPAAVPECVAFAIAKAHLSRNNPRLSAPKPLYTGVGGATSRAMGHQGIPAVGGRRVTTPALLTRSAVVLAHCQVEELRRRLCRRRLHCGL